MQMIKPAAPQHDLLSTVLNFALNKLAYIYTDSGYKVDLKSTILLMHELMFRTCRCESLKAMSEQIKQAHSLWHSKCDKNIKCHFQTQMFKSCQLKVSNAQLKVSNAQLKVSNTQLTVSKVQRSCKLKVSKVQRSCKLKVSKVQRSCKLKVSKVQRSTFQYSKPMHWNGDPANT